MEATKEKRHPCRKCGKPNPSSNDYCRQCGALLAISTAMIQAQRRPIMPIVKGLSGRWIIISTFVTIGFSAVLLSGVALLAWLFFDKVSSPGPTDLASTLKEFAGFAAAGVAAFLLAFGLAAFTIARIAGRPTTVEAVISAFAVHALLAAVGSAITSDAVYVSVLMVIPSAVVAGLGGKIGELFGWKSRKT